MRKNRMGRFCFNMRFLQKSHQQGVLLPMLLLVGVAEIGWAANAISTPLYRPVEGAAVRTTVKVDRSTGRLVRTQVISPREVPRVQILAQEAQSETLAAPRRSSQADASRAAVDKIVEEAAERHAVDPLLARSVLAVESAYNQFATSPKGAMGYMQLMPSTAKQLGVANAYDARQNIEGGVKFLRYLQGKFSDERLVLAAYNAGEAAVKKHGWIPPYPETIDYVYKVGKRYGEARRREGRSAKAVAPEAKPEPKIAQMVDAEGRIHLRLP